MSTSRRSASRYLPDDAADVAVLRVLWQLAQGMVWPWLIRDICEADAVRRATGEGLVAPPVGDHLGYHLTDAGRERIVEWYQAFESGQDDLEHSKAWRAVTLR
jgi:hypothetical protein